MLLRHSARLTAALAAISLALTPVQVSAQAARKPAASAPAPGLTRAASPESVGFDSARLAKLDTYMQGVVAEGRVAGMTTLLARHGKIVSFKTYGMQSLAAGTPMSEDTIFRIYSMTKPITGVAMMILFEEGKWRLDDPVTRFIPEFKDLKVMTGVDEEGNGTPVLVPMKRPPTMREIMSHTAGFGYGLQDKHPVDKLFRENRALGTATLQDMINATAKIPLVYQPGESWRYSISVDIQGYLVEKISGKPLAQFMDERIFRPLKMKDTAFYVPADKKNRFSAVYAFNREARKIEEAHVIFGNPLPTYLIPPTAPSGGGGLVGTTMDYARFAQMIANKGQLDGVRILSPATVELMGTNMIAKNVLVNSNGTTASRFNEAVGFGLDFMVVDDPRRAGSLEGKGSMSWGGAAGTWFWVDPTNDLIFVGMIQRLGGTGDVDLREMARTLTYQALVHPEK